MKPTNVGPQSQQSVITNKPDLTAYSRNVENERDALELFFINEIVGMLLTHTNKSIKSLESGKYPPLEVHRCH